MAKIWIEFEVPEKVEQIGEPKVFFGEAEGPDGPLSDMIVIDEAYFTRDWEDDSFFVFRFIKAFD